MAGREVREYTNLSDPKDKKLGKGKDKIDDEDITFQRMVAKGSFLITCPGREIGLSNRVVDASRCKRLQENEEATFMGEAFEHAALDSDDLLYLKEQMEAEDDAERLLRRTEKRAFAAFKKAASLADSSPASVPLPLRVEPKPKSGIRQHDLLKNVVEIKPKRQRVSSPSDGSQSSPIKSRSASSNSKFKAKEEEKELSLPKTKTAENEREELSLSITNKAETETKREAGNPVKGLLGLAYASSDDED